LENPFPESSSDWHRQSSLESLEQKCVTQFYPPSFASINPMAHIHQDFLKPHCDRQVYFSAREKNCKITSSVNAINRIKQGNLSEIVSSVDYVIVWLFLNSESIFH
jgi:hypothetical protein